MLAKYSSTTRRSLSFSGKSAEVNLNSFYQWNTSIFKSCYTYQKRGFGFCASTGGFDGRRGDGESTSSNSVHSWARSPCPADRCCSVASDRPPSSWKACCAPIETSCTDGAAGDMTFVQSGWDALSYTQSICLCKQRVQAGSSPEHRLLEDRQVRHDR